MINQIKKYRIGKNRNADYKVMFAFTLFCILVSFYKHYDIFSWERLGSYSSTLRSFSYDICGFSSRSFLGSVYKILYNVIPNIFGYRQLFYIVVLESIIFDVILFIFFKYLLSKIVNDDVYKKIFIIFLFAISFLVISYSSCDNLGKPDVIQLILIMLQVYLIIEDKYLLVIPFISIICVLIHEGYFFMNQNIVLALLIYKSFKNRNNKYLILLLVNTAMLLSLTAYFLYFSPKVNIDVATILQGISKKLNRNGTVHTGLVQQKITDIIDINGTSSQSNIDNAYKIKELNELPIFIVLFIPFLINPVKYLVSIFRNDDSSFINNFRKNAFYLSYFLIGFVLVLFEFVLFCDFGRYILWIIFYFSCIITFPSIIDNSEHNNLAIIDSFSNNLKLDLYKLAYTFLITPFFSANICYLSSFIMAILG